MAFAAVAAAIAMLTPIVRTTALLNWLPDPVEWYFRPVPGRTNFTMFPWAGFVFAGAAAGVVIDEARRPDRSVRLHAALGAGAVVIAAAGYRASFLPSIYARSDFWTSSPTFFFLRVGLMLALLVVTFMAGHLIGHGVERAAPQGAPAKGYGFAPLALMGKASLFVYWVHVELVYGVFSRPFRGRLSFEQVLVAYALFTLFMLGVVLARNRAAEALSN
jgi:uncharacterized membrane protein